MTRTLTLVVALVVVGCGDGSGEVATTPSGAAAPSQVSSEPLARSDAEPVEQALSDLDAQETASGEIRITLPESVLFDFDQADIRADARETLQDVATVLDHYAGAPVTIEGHTDNKGTADYNRDLSERRASAVADELAQAFSIERGRMTTRGLGESQPVAENETASGDDDPEGRQQNRRVEVVVDAREVTDSAAEPEVVDPTGG